MTEKADDTGLSGKAGSIKDMVRTSYAAVAQRKSGCCCGGPDLDAIAEAHGYSEEDLEKVPEGAHLGLGCGNPLALASLKGGETVLDLGSGAGFDCFLAAYRVGPKGHVIGVDMTYEMVRRAREHAETAALSQVEFRLGEIEHLPVEDESIDLVISNCVINLSPDKEQVFREAYRVLRQGGTLMISDIVITGILPEKVSQSAVMYAGCIAGAVSQEEYVRLLEKAGFMAIEMLESRPYPLEEAACCVPDEKLAEGPAFTAEEVAAVAGAVASVKIQAKKML
ncbi:MAG TPA: arsenite methyltransferase [Methanoculleus sp.]|nr:arsenite methyltransferase [Methanoculleus sp.]